MSDTLTRISPALARVYRNVKADAGVDAHLNELAVQFLNDAKAIDPTIKGGWVCNTLMLENRAASGAVAGVYFERDEAPFVRKRRAAE
ncbi:MAG: hypothetical protein KF810_20690 [Rhizobiaceae bacterium]|nr:hypothetical protein [Rhizobiaceae bacterium]